MAMSAARSLADFGYEYDASGKLVQIGTGDAFKFVDQQHYEALGDCVEKHIQTMMKTHCQLEEVQLPLLEDFSETNANGERPQVNIFVSPDWQTNSDKLLVLIQGSGAVRAGQWARSCCINSTLAIGSVLPYVEEAKRQGYAVLVLNPNYNYYKFQDGKQCVIPFNESPEKHVLYVFSRFVLKSVAKEVYIVAHSFGGVSTMVLVAQAPDELIERIAGIALTDSVHSSFKVQSLPQSRRKWLRSKCRDWVASKTPLDTPLPKQTQNAAVPCVSAGDHRHEYTSGCAFPSIFPFFASLSSANQQDEASCQTHCECS